MTLLSMVDFFKMNNISPNEMMGPQMQTLENLIKKRINAVIAILKDMEKNKVNPTLGILESLMETADPKNNYENRKRDYEEDDSDPDFYK
nr:BfmA/BtgA family mobilization protein [Salegentibacter maritimus]